MTIRSAGKIALQIILPLVLLTVGAIIGSHTSSKTSTSEIKFLYHPSIYLQQRADPTSTLFHVLYKVVNNAGRYFIVKVNFKS